MPGRKLDIPRIKRVVMFLSGVVLGAWSAVTGISAQAAGAPYITFMLGYAAPKAASAAFMFAFWAGALAVVCWSLVTGLTPPIPLCLLTAAGATFGAVVSARVWPGGIPRRASRIGQSLIVIGLVFVISEGVRSRFGGPRLLSAVWLTGPLGWTVVGFVAAAIARALSVPTGVMLVPLLVFVVAMDPAQAIMSSLAVAVLAGIVPALGYRVRREDDTLLGPSMSLGGAIGGATGGWLIARLADPADTWPLVGFGVTAMMLCSWLAYRASD